MVKALGLDSATGKAMCCEIGKDIYMDRLTAARADGVISDEERRRLQTIRTIFALQVDVPASGLDYDKAIGMCRQRAEAEVNAVRTRIGYLWRAVSSMRDMNPAIGDHHQVKACTACLAEWQDTVSDIIYAINNTPGADADSYTIITEATARATLLAAEIDRSSMDVQVNEILTWKRMTTKQVEKANATAQRSAESDRQAACRAAAVQAGFGLERGSASARAWAYCVIAEECLTDPGWAELPSDASSSDTEPGRFRAWLLMRPASFWTEVFPEGGMVMARERFQAEEVSGRKRAKRRADLDLQII